MDAEFESSRPELMSPAEVLARDAHTLELSTTTGCCVILCAACMHPMELCGPLMLSTELGPICFQCTRLIDANTLGQVLDRYVVQYEGQ